MRIIQVLWSNGPIDTYSSLQLVSTRSLHLAPTGLQIFYAPSPGMSTFRMPSVACPQSLASLNAYIMFSGLVAKSSFVSLTLLNFHAAPFFTGASKI
ncbi:hypothetical protein CBOM_05147 [Ceraceosorus bombacis]|uniref:Uncharacterized protein n=1 Tax=Ceraceosorus bombacis TaxID=401625 RepID=A0A0P1BIV6_9BASI|nr:hypothetical protein CBOM_05147 [Ceraceosorus bombacis]